MNLLLILITSTFWYTNVLADMTIKIQEGIRGAIPIAIVPFTNAESETVPEKVDAIIAADLIRSGRFTILPEQDMFNLPNAMEDIDFREWRILGQDALIIGKALKRGNNYKVQFELIDILKKEQVVAYELTVSKASLRSAAHTIADIVYEKMTGTRGAFSTRIAYITEDINESGTSQISLKISDADGFNQQTIVESNEPLMSPAWSPDGKKIAYVSFENKQQTIFVQDLSTGNRKQVSAYPGINSAPDWSPDGRKLALVLSKDGDPEIYVLNIADGKLTRITENVAIDTEPTWSPDEKTLIFTSDRGGSRQLYKVNANGGEAKRLTFKGDYNAAPVFSKDGNFIALVTRHDGKFKIGLLNLARNSLQELTTGPLDESPSFTANSSIIVYGAKTLEHNTLSAVSIDGRVQQNFLKFDKEKVREPICSPTIN